MINKSQLLYAASQSRALDSLAIESGISGFELMQRAANGVFQQLILHWPNKQRVTIFCGTGNNGGDGYLIAMLAYQHGLQVKVYQLGDLNKQSGDALSARIKMESAGLHTEPYSELINESKTEVIVDAIFGTGLARPVTGLWLSAIQQINRSNAKKIAVDIASGLHADTGCEMGEAVKADLTVTFIARKLGLYTADGRTCSGDIHFEDLDVARVHYEKIISKTALINACSVKALFDQRQENSHKGMHGNVLVIGGAPGMSGAVMMAASAALRSGCGLVNVATHQAHAVMINYYQPEIMSHGVTNSAELTPLLASADVIVCGPGLGQSDWAEALFECIVKTDIPIILDADGLNLLAKKPRKKKNWVLTPHPGEAARLLNCSTSQIQADRFKAIASLQAQYGGVCVLKGAGTLISDGTYTNVCTAGNPGMASAGMGDILSGVIGSLLAQASKMVPLEVSLFNTVTYGVDLHSRAGDAAAIQDGEKGLLATDLLPHLRRLVNE